MGTGEPWGQAQFLPVLEPHVQESQSNVKFVQDTSKFWYKPHLSRDQGEMPACPALGALQSHLAADALGASSVPAGLLWAGLSVAGDSGLWA